MKTSKLIERYVNRAESKVSKLDAKIFVMMGQKKPTKDIIELASIRRELWAIQDSLQRAQFKIKIQES